MKIRNRLLATILCLSMAFSIAPITTFADETENETATILDDKEIASDDGVIEIQGDLPKDADVEVITPEQETMDVLNDSLTPDAEDYFCQVGFYDIIIQSDGEKWQPNENVTITLDATDFNTEDKVDVYHILDDANAIENALKNKTAKSFIAEDTKSLQPAIEAAKEYTNVENTVYYTVLSSEKDEVVINADGTISFTTDSFSIFQVKAYNDETTKEAIAANSTITMKRGEVKYFKWEYDTSRVEEEMERGTWTVEAGDEYIDFEVYNPSPSYNYDSTTGKTTDTRYQYYWLKLTARDVSGSDKATIQFEYPIVVGSGYSRVQEVFYVRVLETENTFYIDDQIAENGCLVPKTTDNTIDLTSLTFTFEWSRSDGATIKSDALTAPYITTVGAVNVGIDRGGIDAADIGIKSNPMKTYTVTIKQGEEVIGTASSEVAYGNEVLNGSFEYPVSVAPTHDYPNGAANLYWKTTSASVRENEVCQDIEILSTTQAQAYPDNHNVFLNTYGIVELKPGVTYTPNTKIDVKDVLPDYNFPEGTQAAEINCDAPGALYQDVLTYPGAELYWSLYHRARNYNGSTSVHAGHWNPDGHEYTIGNTKLTDQKDYMYVVIAPTDQVEHIKTQDQLDELIDNAKTDNVFKPGDYSYNGINYTIWEVADDHTKWEFHQSGTSYTVGTGQYLTRFFFAAGDTVHDRALVAAGGEANYSGGNFIDAVVFNDEMPYQVEYYLDGVLQNDLTESGAITPDYTYVVNATKTSDSRFSEKHLLKTEINGRDNAGLTSMTGVYSEHNVLQLYYVTHGVNVNKQIEIIGYDNMSDDAKELIKEELKDYQVEFDLKEVTNQTETTVASVTVNINPETLTGSGEFLDNGKSFLPESEKTYKIVEKEPENTNRLELVEKADDGIFTDKYFYSHDAKNKYQLYSYLTIEKNVTGNLGDINKTFDFTLEVTNPATKETWKKENFMLKSGASTTYKIPYDYEYSITETDYTADGYSTTITVTDLEKGGTPVVSESLKHTGTLTTNTKVTYTNNKEVEVDTGVNTNTPIKMAILFMVVAITSVVGIKLYLTNERKRRYGR